MNDTVRNLLFNAAGVALIAWVLWSKLKRRQRTTDDLSQLARVLNLMPQSGALDRVAAADRAELAAGEAGRARAALIQALPGARASYEGTVNGVRVTMVLCAERHGTQPRSWIDDDGIHLRLVRPSSAPATVLPLLQRMTALVGALDQALS